MNLSGKAAIITGASRGLGEALAHELSRRGAKVVLVARGEQEVERVAEHIRREGGEAHALAYDVGDKNAIHPIAQIAAELVGPIDILVNNASALGPVPLRNLADTACEDLEAVLQTNLVGPFRLAKAVLGSMVVRGSGAIVSISSDAAVEPYPAWGAYGASKAALDHLTRILAAEIDGTGVRAFAVDPGEMNTKMHADAIPDADPKTLADPRDIAARIADMLERAKNGERLVASKWERA